MKEVEETVHRAVFRVARQRSPAFEHVTNSQRLTIELGLKSLDLAKLVAILELELGVDPFAKLVPITEVRTVGDLCNAYRLALEGKPPSSVPPSFAASRDRAARRSMAQGEPTDVPPDSLSR
jgi:acyl carrier protein